MGSQSYKYSSRGSDCNQSVDVFTTPENHRSRPNALCVVPCTVSHLQSAIETHSGFTVGEIDINMVSVVGIVRRVLPSLSSILYLLDDMTGTPIDARFWHDSEEDGVQKFTISPGMYIKIIGRLRSFESQRSVIGLHIHILTDLNEITSHILEVIQAHMVYTPPQNKVNDASVSSDGTEQHQSAEKVEGVSSAQVSDFSPAQNQVFNLIKSCPDASGVSLWTLSTCVSPQCMLNLQQCLQFLINEGHIYTTVDDSHFKAVE